MNLTENISLSLELGKKNVFDKEQYTEPNFFFFYRI